MSDPSLRGTTAAFVRSFTVQGSWNYRTLQGCGFAFALLPVLRSVHGRSGAALERAVARHAEHFNAHPYLSTLAVGATARLEIEGAPPDVVRRFKTAVRGPLGSLGDRLVWVAWLPLTLLCGLVAAVGGAPPWLPAALFLSVYNAGHVGLRLWSFRSGLRKGADVATTLRSAKLARFADRLSGAGAAGVGLLLGLSAVEATAVVDREWLWLAGGAGAFALGVAVGPSVWRWTSWGVLFVAALIMAVGGAP